MFSIPDLSTWVLEMEQHVQAQGLVIDYLECWLCQREDRTMELEVVLDKVEANQKAGDLILSSMVIPPLPTPHG